MPLRPGIMELLIAVADERHRELKNELVDNYASAGGYLLRLIEYRKEWHQSTAATITCLDPRGDDDGFLFPTCRTGGMLKHDALAMCKHGVMPHGVRSTVSKERDDGRAYTRRHQGCTGSRKVTR